MNPTEQAAYERGLAQGKAEQAEVVRKLREQLTIALHENLRLRGGQYTRLDAVARQGSHGAVANIIP